MSYSFSENQWGEKYIEELNRTDFITMKSDDFFSKVLDFDLELENAMYIVVGSDSGLLLPYLAKHTLGRGSRIVVVEHDDVYPLVAAQYRGLLNANDDKASTSHKSISLHKFSTWRDEVFDGSERTWLLGGQIRLVESNASSVDYSRIYTAIFRSIRVASEEQINDISVTLNRHIFSEMQFRNAVDSTTPLKADSQFGQGKTAVVLGGGTSLDTHIGWVKANREKLFILSVSRLATKLMNLDIKPDLVLSVDSMDISYEVCKQGILWTDVPLVYNYHVSPKLLQQWQGPAYYLGRRLPWHGDKELKGKVASAGPTVGHTAVFVASQLGFSNILMTGIDFCFSSSAGSHANDSPEQMIQKMPHLCDAQVETYSGRLAGTSLMLKAGLDALEDIGALVNRHEPILFNLSQEAGLCPSIPYMDVNEVQLCATRPDFSDHVNTDVTPISTTQLNSLERELKIARHQFKKIRGLCSKARECVVRMHAPEAGLNASKHSHKLTRLRKQLEADFPDHLNALLYANGAEFSRTNSPTDFDDMSPEELTTWGCHYYDLLDAGAKTMIEHIDRVPERIQLRRDELADDADVRVLMKRWRQDKTPGRVLRWKRLHWARVPAKDRAWVQRSIGKFRATLAEPGELVTKILTGGNEYINNVMKSLVFLSQHKRLDELIAIESKLSGEVWPYNALLPFVSGLIKDLQQDTPAAIAHFQATIDSCSSQLETQADSLVAMQRLIEECLVRMTQCFMRTKDHQSALTTLGMLCEMLPSYIVSYAKMLHLCNQTGFAIELLENYIALYPSNKKALFLLERYKPATTDATEIAPGPEYEERISGAVQAIMGDSPENIT